MKFVVDRIEENIAVIELPTGKMVNIPIDFFPFSLKEGRKYNMEITEEKNNESLEQKFNRLFK